jgi:hypothetical protein
MGIPSRPAPPGGRPPPLVRPFPRLPSQTAHFERRLALLEGIAWPARQQPRLGRIRRRIESVFRTFEDTPSLERHGARAPEGLRTRVDVRILALAATVWLDHRLGRPSRSLVADVA